MNNSNQFTIHVVSITIALLAITCVAFVCILSYKGLPIPPELNTLAGGLVGAVTTMLVKTTPTPNTPAEVQINNTKENPVKTEDV